jgi:hypothetical protein
MSGVNSESENDGFVEVDADLFLDARLVADDLARRTRRGSKPGFGPAPRFWNGEAGDVAADIFDRVGVGALDVFLRLRVDREGTSWTVDARLVAVTIIRSPWLASVASLAAWACASSSVCAQAGVATARPRR